MADATADTTGVPFGINFFPSVRLSQKSGEQYYDEALRLSILADTLGFSHVRTVEHYFRPYGGLSPNPVVFLTMIAARTRRVRLVTGAVIPIFNHPLKLAAELAMLDCISHGRLDVGFARAFLPEEFDAFERSMDESRARYESGIEAIIRLWTEDDVVHRDAFHAFGPLSLMPKPVQQPHPPVFVAAIGTPQSFDWAGEQGHNLMIVPYISRFEDVQANLQRYRDRFAASHPTTTPRRTQMSFHVHVAETDSQAQAEARPHLDQYLEVFKESAAAWRGRASSNYAGYSAVLDELERMSFDRALHETRLFVGSPETVAQQIRHILDLFGDVEPSLQILYGNMPYETAERSVRLFAEAVMPRFQTAAARADGQPARRL
jgi:alkanesulfonate monooxygenase SsuD/methylene tetrahydromethanopterin reductase-like flavin-dependent oxidoreductase (luciferase family)